MILLLIPVGGLALADAIRSAENDGITDPQPRPTKRYFGISACTQCHTQPPDKDVVLCRCREVAIWREKDKHKEAFNVLFGDRAKRMGQLLGYKGAVTQEAACVNCHGVYVGDARLQHSSFRPEDGVSCAVCHGVYVGWVDLHGSVLRRDEWRGYSRQTKEERFGMADLWDPAKRARLCLSCHLGNAEEGKVVTHAMYAAGHPPLPGFEIATFSDAMPRHWQYIREKSLDVRKLLKFEPTDAQWEETRLVLEGGLATFGQQMRLLAAEARPGTGESWPEFAQFDCYACHHDLKTDSWRQKRGTSGRPQMRAWPTTLVRLGLRQLGENEQDFDDKLRALKAAFTQKPFGDAPAIAAASAAMEKWCGQVLEGVLKKPVNRDRAISLLRELCTLPSIEIPDYDSARQIGWAIQVIYGELSYDTRPLNHDMIEKQMRKLRDLLKLDLPAGSAKSVEKELPESLRHIYLYEPGPFKAVLSQLLSELPAK
jgi:hypothetical protein